MHYVAWRIESLAWLETCFGEDNLTALYLVGTTVNKVMYIIFAFLVCYNVYIILTENCLFILMLVHAENKELLFCPPCWCIVDLVLCCFLHNVQSGSPLSHACKQQQASPQAKWSSGRSLLRRHCLYMCSPNVSTYMYAGFFLHKSFSWLVIFCRTSTKVCKGG